jgi:AcrR family transcriptional regulator
VKPPRQARSQKTLENVLDAAESVIAEAGISGLTVSEVVRRAGSSVGAFYARFPDKDALLSTLHERVCGEALATAELALDPVRWESADLPTAVTEIVRFTAALTRERRGLMLAFISMAANDAAYAGRRARLEKDFARLLFAFLRARSADIAHPDPALASEVAIRIIMGSLEYGAMIHRSSEEGSSGDDRLAEELAHAVLSYLGVKPLAGRLRATR